MMNVCLFWMDYYNLSVYFWYVYGDELLFFIIFLNFWLVVCIINYKLLFSDIVILWNNINN